MESRDDFHNWQHAAFTEIVDTTVFVDDGAYDNRERAPCPLCQAMTAEWGSGQLRGWTPEGLRRHLEGYGNTYRCRVFETAWKMHLDENHDKFVADESRRYQDRERRKTTEPMILRWPNREPDFFKPEYSWETDRVRSDDDLIWAQEQLREAGVVTERTRNVVAYRLVRDDFMALADPRFKNVIDITVYKQSGKNRWKEAGRFNVRGVKNVPAKIKERFQNIIDSVTKVSETGSA